MNQLNCAHVALPITRVVCYGMAAFFVGKNALRATAGYSLYAGSTIAACFDKAALAKNMEANGDLYLDLVKKNAAKDFTKAIAFGLAGYAAEYAGDLVEAKLASIAADQPLVTMISDSIGKGTSKLGHVVGASSPSIIEKVSSVVEKVRLEPNPNSMFAHGLGLCGSLCQENVGSMLTTGATAFESGVAYVKAIDFKKVQASIVDKGSSTVLAARQWTSDAQEDTVNFLTPKQEKFDAIYNATLEHPIKAATIGTFVLPTGLYATSRIVVEIVK